jgi:hypothetical protein
MIIIQDAMGIKDLHYRLPPAELGLWLKRCDRHLLFSILADCVGLLTNAPAMTRVQDIHRRGGLDAGVRARLASRGEPG